MRRTPSGPARVMLGSSDGLRHRPAATARCLTWGASGSRPASTPAAAAGAVAAKHLCRGARHAPWSGRVETAAREPPGGVRPVVHRCCSKRRPLRPGLPLFIGQHATVHIAEDDQRSAPRRWIHHEPRFPQNRSYKNLHAPHKHLYEAIFLQKHVETCIRLHDCIFQ